MVQRGGRSCLGQRGAGRDRTVGLEDLERHGAVELEIASEVDPGEGARTDLRFDQVVREEMPGPEGEERVDVRLIGHPVLAAQASRLERGEYPKDFLAPPADA